MNILTFDIEDWFHLLENRSTRREEDWGAFKSRLPETLGRILDLLEEMSVKGTFFVLGWIARKHPDLVRQISAHGHEVASHSDLHQLVYEQVPQSFQKDVERSVGTLEEIVGKKVRAFRAPGFSITPRVPWAFDILADAGIEIDCSIFPARRAHGGFPDFGASEPVLIEAGGRAIKEFPMNTARLLGSPFIFSGGGYFRLFPYGMLRYLMNESNYVMTYFHPRDFDPEQPVVPSLGPYRRFKSYYGLRRAFPKLKRLLADFPFVSLYQAEALIPWHEARQVRLAG